MKNTKRVKKAPKPVKKSFSQKKILVGFILVALAVGLYAWYGQRVTSVKNYEDCVNAGGTTEGTEIPGIHGECKIYGQTYLEDGYLAWDIGQRFTDVAHKENFPPAVVQNASMGPKELVDALKYDNGGCAINEDMQQKAFFKIIKVVDGKYAKLEYGCVSDYEQAPAYMLSVKVGNTWKNASPTNQFMDDGTPSCAMVKYFAISQKLEAKCFIIQNDKYVKESNNIQ